MSNVTAIRPRPAPRPDVYLSPKEVCALVPGLSVRTLRELRAAGRGPRYAKLTERKVVYIEADVHAWIHDNIHTTKDQRGNHA